MGTPRGPAQAMAGGPVREAAVTVSNGERRELGPGPRLSFEGIEGEGHMSTPLTDDLSFAMFPH